MRPGGRDRQLQGHHPTEADPDHRGRRPTGGIHHRGGIGGTVRHGVAAGDHAAPPEPPIVVGQELEARGEGVDEQAGVGQRHA